MKFSYDKLWEQLESRNMTKQELLEASGIAKSTLHKMKLSKNVNTEPLVKICRALNCQVQDIMEYVEIDKESVNSRAKNKINKQSK